MVTRVRALIGILHALNEEFIKSRPLVITDSDGLSGSSSTDILSKNRQRDQKIQFTDICIRVEPSERYFPESRPNGTGSSHEIRENGRIVKQVERIISTAKLNMLPYLHPQPINVVVFHDPSGKPHLGSSLALRCFQRLSIPSLAARLCR